MTRIVGSLVIALFLVVAAVWSTPSRAGSVAKCGLTRATIVGTQRDDVITGTQAFDVIAGLAGNDTIVGGGGGDRICGGRGNDKITTQDDPSDGLAIVEGGPGNDELALIANDFALHLVSGGPGDDKIDCGTRHSSLSYDEAAAGVVVDLQAGTARGGAGRDTLIRCGGVSGSSFADVLRGTPRGEMLEGNGGNDRIVGRAGNDHFDAGPGNDSLSGGPGEDEVDYAYAPRRQATIVVNLRTGRSRGVKAGVGRDNLRSIERVAGGYGPDIIIGNAAANVLTGNDGDDRLFGADGRDTLKGQRGRDKLDGGPGRDIGDGGPQRDLCLSLEAKRRCE